jgi:hypothetical protein
MLYRERLRVPALWWVLAVLSAVSLLLAFGFYLGPGWGIGVALLGLLVAGSGFLSGAAVIEVDGEAIRVGRAVIEHEYVASCRALDGPATRVRSGVQADARAHLVLRPYVSTAVEIELDDPADPVPYWLVSSRRPEAFAAAVRQAAAARLTG